MARPSSAHFKKNQASYLKSSKIGGGQKSFQKKSIAGATRLLDSQLSSVPIAQLAKQLAQVDPNLNPSHI